MAPKQPAAPTVVYAVVMGLPAPQIISVHAQEQDAQEAVTQGLGATYEQHTLHYGTAADNTTVKLKAKTPKKSSNESGDDGEAKKKNDKKTHIPDGRADSLIGYALMFSGTFEHMDRATCEATAVKFGGTVSKKLDEVNYVVLGTKPGPKKLEEIQNKGVMTMNEAQFVGLIGAHFEEPPAKKTKK